MLAELQHALAAAALGGDPQPAAALLRPGIPADRLAIYRNNVLGGFAEVLAAAYPSVVRVLGCETFQQAGRGFAALYPPLDPQMWRYGEGFAAFLEAQPAGRVPLWLPDIARLDRAMHEAYFARDAERLAPGRLAALATTADPSSLHLFFHPTVQVVASDWPVYGLWRAVREGGPLPEPERSPEAVLVARPGLEVLCRRLVPWQAGFISALLLGVTFGEAVSWVPAEDAVAAIQDQLAFLLQANLVTGFAASPESLEG
ncbi:MAG: DNA-binding domain-containing protein [Rhodospirillaceae bacterium]